MTARPTRVAHILGNLEYAGAQKVVFALVRELPQYSHTVIVNATDPLAMRDSVAAKCRTLHVPFPRTSRVGGILFLPRLAMAFREATPDVVLVHGFGNQPLVSIAARMAGVRAPVSVAPNGCVVEEIAARAEAGRDNRLHDGAAGHRLLMVAWIDGAEDHEVVIKAVALLRERGLDVQLSFAGGVSRQSRQDDLEKLARARSVTDAVTFLGVRNDVPELMGASDVVIHAAHHGGFGLVLAEAFASRTPVVATDIASFREMLDNGRCGTLVPSRDHVAIANAVQALLTNTLHRRTVVNAAFKRVNELYGVQHMAARYASLIDSATR